MKLSANGLKHLIRFEGKRLIAYRDPVGLPTVGYGHLIKDSDGLKIGDRISEEKARALLASDVTWSENAITRFVSFPLNQNQFDALVSFVYNVGQTTFLKSSVLRLLNERKPHLAMQSLTKYVYAKQKKLKGLINRRAAEKALFWSK